MVARDAKAGRVAFSLRKKMKCDNDGLMIIDQYVAMYIHFSFFEGNMH
jgi:hypothetical protein